MYIDLPSIEPPSRYPWILSLEQRQSMLVGGEFKIAYYYEETNDSSFRYRTYNMCEAINTSQEKPRISASFFYRSDSGVFAWLARTANLLVICRSGHDELLGELIQLFRDQSKSVIFDTDDLIIDTAYCKPVALALGEDYANLEVVDNWHKYFSRMRSAALLCDAVCTPNSYLSAIASKSLAIPSVVIPNSLNHGQIQASTCIADAKKLNGFARDNRFTFGYFSGTRTHQHDFSVIAEPLSLLMKDNENIDLVICGYLDVDANLSGFKDRIRYEPFRDYVSLQRLIGECEISLAPLVYSTFTNCKSDLKFFEPAAVATACMASPTYAFRSAITSGVDGIICQRHHWFSSLSEICASPLTVAKISQRSHETAMQKYTPQRTYSHIVKALSLTAHAS